MLALIREGFFWSMMCKHVINWLKLCKRCQKAKGPYNHPNVKQGLLIVNPALDLLCLNFTKMDCSKEGKENILIMMNILSNFTVAVITPNEQE